MPSTASSLAHLHLELADSPAALLAWLVEMLERDEPTLARRVTVCGDSLPMLQQLRAACIDRDGGERLLYGVRWLPVSLVAADLLARSGAGHQSVSPEARHLQLLHVFEQADVDTELSYFGRDDLSRPGTIETWTRTLDDLERAGLSPAALHAMPGDRIGDVARIWERVARLEQSSGQRAPARLFRESGEAVALAPELAAACGSLLVVLARDPDEPVLDWLAALPEVRTALLDARPARPDTRRWLDRLPQPARRQAPAADALEPFRRRLFAATTMPEAATGDQPDVVVEEYPGVDEEVDATVDWVFRQLLDGCQLDRLAVVAADVDVYAPLLRDRLARREVHATGAAPVIDVRVLDGRSLVDVPRGRLAARIVDAVRGGLASDDLIDLVPQLVAPPDGESPATPSEIAELLYDAGVTGGSRARFDETASIVDRLHRHAAALAAESAAPRPAAAAPAVEGPSSLSAFRTAATASSTSAADSEPQPTTVPPPTSERHARRLACSTWTVGVIDELQALAQSVAHDDDLATLVELLLRTLPAASTDDDAVAACLERLRDHPLARTAHGRLALDTIANLLVATRLDPAASGTGLCVASPRAAAGLAFDAVRFVGAAEGRMPRNATEDPVLPDAFRAQIIQTLDALHFDRAPDRVLTDVHDVYRVLAGARRHVTFSAPRQWIDGADCEVSSWLLETTLALDALTGTQEDTISRTTRGGNTNRRQRRSMPLTARALLDAVSERRRDRPAAQAPQSWTAASGGVLDLARLLESSRRLADPFVWSSLDGDLSDVWQPRLARGLSAEHPISASRLAVLLGCPYRFLLEHVLGFAELPPEPRTDRIEPRQYGSLVHAILDTFFGEHGHAFCARGRTLDAWVALAGRRAEAVFERFIASYPLRSAAVVARERCRLVDDVTHFLTYEWQRPAAGFTASELDFGFDEPLTLATPDGALFIRGRIDRVDRFEDGALSVRDWKTGRVRSRQDEPMGPAVDLQLAVYAQALLALGAQREDFAGASVREVAYVHASKARDTVRAFAGDDLQRLLHASREWLGLAATLLENGTFPRTVDADDCRYCPFQAHCGDDAQQRSAAKLAAAELPGGAGAFGAFRGIARHV